MKQTLDTAAICLGAVAGFLWGEFDGMLIALIAMVTLDYITGVIAAARNRELSSRIGFYGLLKKTVTLLIAAVANIIDVRILNSGGIVRSAVICYFAANEGISLLENAARMGIPINSRLMSILKQLRNDNDKED